MGIAIDTVGLKYTAPATATAAYAALSALTGDSLTVRSFQPPASAVLEEVCFQASTIHSLRVRSPLLHDDVQGIRFKPTTTPTRFSLPQVASQYLQPQDTLIVEVDDQTNSATYTAALRVFYTDLLGASARLKMPGDVNGNVKSIKPVEVSVSAVAQTWVDTLITATEDLLHANTDYAVLGFMVDTACCAVGVKGQETGNLRVTAAGVDDAYGTSEVFVTLSEEHNMPHIPVFNAANKGNVYVSLLANATATITVTLMLAELQHTVS